MLETVQSQACDTIYMDSVLNPVIIHITENTIHYKHCLIQSGVYEKILHNTNMTGNQLSCMYPFAEGQEAWELRP